MPITTISEIRALLQIKEASPKEEVIIDLIPIIQDWIIEHCNNKFLDDRVEYSGTTFTFVENDSSADTITDSESAFVTEDFASGIDIYVSGSDKNDGHYYVATAAAGTLTLSTDDDLVDEAAGDYITITRVTWPKGLKTTVASMIQYELKKLFQGVGVNQESMGEHSVIWEKTISGYPESIIKRLNPYMYMKTK
jgi:hypothetical protein